MRPLALAFALFPALALARPADRVVELKPGEEKVLREGEVDASAATVEGKAVAAEALPAGEVLLDAAKSPGSALVLLDMADGGHVFWRVRVGQKAAPAVPAAAREKAKKACPGLAEGKDEDDGTPLLTAKIENAECLGALRELLAGDAYTASQLRLSFTPAAIDAQVLAFQKRLAKEKLSGITVTAEGVDVVLEGNAPTKEVRRALLALFDESVGRLLVDDRVGRPAGDPDAPRPPEPAPDALDTSGGGAK